MVQLQDLYNSVSLTQEVEEFSLLLYHFLLLPYKTIFRSEFVYHHDQS